MYEKNVYDKKKLTALRIVLAAVGAVVAGTAFWQFFVYMPDIMRWQFQISVAVVSASILAAIFALSAKPVYRLFSQLSGEIARIISALGAKGTVAVVSGLFAAGMAGYMFDVMIRGALTVWATRILSDVLVAAVFSVLCCRAFVKWVASSDDGEPVRRQAACNGYLLTASCFSDERVFVAADLLCNVKLSDNVLKALWKFDCGAEALERLKILTASGAVSELRGGEFETAEDYASAEAKLAAAHRLKPVELGGTCFPEIGGASLDAFAQPDGAFREKFSSRADADTREDADDTNKSELAADVGKTDGEIAQTDYANGQIIIDK
ncbi:MAG: hypothetical protein NC184_02205 [Roseburia sp.]|nr:hypothetical protein [Roseburia sp.]